MPARALIDRTLCVAPMMAWTDRHCRFLHRLAAPHALLFTEMITTGALLHGRQHDLLRFHPNEHPVALQLGGSDPAELAACAVLGAEAGYDEINLNVGCPSPRVQKGCFGASLMREPELVGRCVGAMATAVDIPVTVKCRLGVDDDDSVEFLERFVNAAAELGGCRTFYVHARKALLAGLSPAENRSVPPLRYPRVYDLKRRHPELTIVINGGIREVGELDVHLAAVDGVMIGRAAYQKPLRLWEMDRHLFGERSAASVDEAETAQRIMAAYRRYMVTALGEGTRLADLTRPLLGLFAGQPGARRFRRILSDAPRLKENDIGLLDDALTALRIADGARRERAA